MIQSIVDNFNNAIRVCSCGMKPPPRRLTAATPPDRRARAPPPRRLPVPHPAATYAFFCSVSFSGGVYAPLHPSLLPALAAYLQPAASLLAATQLAALLHAAILAVPFLCALAERRGDTRLLVQLCFLLEAAATLGLAAALSLRSAPLAYASAACAAVGLWQTRAGNLFVLATAFAVGAPARAGRTSAALQLALATTSAAALALLYHFPLLSASAAGEMTPSYTPLTVLFFASQLSWIGVVNAPAEWTALHTFLPPSQPVAAPPRRSCGGLASFLCAAEYRGLRLASAFSGVSQGVSSASISLLWCFAEDSGALPAAELQHSLLLCVGAGALSTLLTAPLFGAALDVVGPLAGISFACLAHGGVLLCLPLLEPTPLLIYGSVALTAHLAILYSAALLPFVALNLFPSLDSFARDAGMFTCLGGVVSAALIFTSGPFLDSFGTTASSTDAQGRARYSDNGYRAFFVLSAAANVYVALVFHLCKRCAPRRKQIAAVPTWLI